MRQIGVVLAAIMLLVSGCAPAVVRPPAGVAGPVPTRVLMLARGADRPLRTVLWVPAGRGRHPIVLFSHGLGGLPEHFAGLAAGWAADGYLVVAPTYPHTNARVRVDRADIRHQAADAAYVLERVRALDRTPGDALAGRLAVDLVAAVGFSAGGTTTLGMLASGHPRWLRAAVSVSGRRPSQPYGGSAVPVLFVHGDRDRVVGIGAGREAYAALPWPKRFVVVHGAGHGQFLKPGAPRYDAVSARIAGFLHRHLT